MLNLGYHVFLPPTEVEFIPATISFPHSLGAENAFTSKDARTYDK